MSGPVRVRPNPLAEGLPATIVESAGDEERVAIWRKLAAEGFSMAPERVRDLVLVIRDDRPFVSEGTGDGPDGRNFRAGLSGVTYEAWLFISHLWVAPSERGKGLGARLLEAAYHEAAARGCRRVHVETRTSRALAFYLREGFVLAGEVPEFLGGEALRVLYRTIPLEIALAAPSREIDDAVRAGSDVLSGSSGEPREEIFPVAPVRER
ncbi:MAG: GNAT family N-acetyltransferase [Rhizobiales bacterium]|nr:GNAT family N-acetyltransferase [Hyphomicrobiales bacterium]